MKNIKELLHENTDYDQTERPIIFDLSKSEDESECRELLLNGHIKRTADDFEEQVREHWNIQNPSLTFSPDFEDTFQNYYKELVKDHPAETLGKWVYYPWDSCITHVLDEQQFFEVRTARNQHLITKEEQEKIYNATIGIAGLSVGHSIAQMIFLEGGAKKIKLADFDCLALSNTNRILSSVENLGLPKTVLASRLLYQINPYAEIELYKGLTEENIERFFDGLDIIIDEIDSFPMKYRMREYARDQKIPLLMATDNEESIMVDVERYDLDPNTKFFSGRLGDVTLEQLSSLDKRGIGRTIATFVGPENATDRMLRSLKDMGKGIVSWPQLGGTAWMNAGVMAYCARRIVSGAELIQGRINIRIEKYAIPNFDSEDSKIERDLVTGEFKQMLGLE